MHEGTADIDGLHALLARLGVEVRKEPMGGVGGGLCTLRGRRVLFVDLDADPLTSWETALTALASDPQVDSLYLPPALREQLDRLRAADAPPKRGLP